MSGNMDDSRQDKQDDIVAYNNFMELADDASIEQLTTDVDTVDPVVMTSFPVDNCAADEGVGRYKALWRRMYRHVGSSFILVLMLIIYTLIGAAVLHHTEYDRERQMHEELDVIRRRIVADITNVTTFRSRDSAVNLSAAVEALVLEYCDARQALNPSSKPPAWTFSGAMYFCSTVYTTIGYGNVVPVTTVGRTITVIYGIIGVPLCLVVMASVGKLLTRAIKYLWMYVRRFYYTGSCRHVRYMIPVSRLKMTVLQRIGYQLRRSTRRVHRAVRRRRITESDMRQRHIETCVPYEVDDEFNLPPAVALIIGMTYTLLGAFMYKSWENWTYFEAFYFTCISLSTIGFGDVVPDHPKFFLASSVYMLIGLSLLAMIIHVFMVALNITITKATTTVFEAGKRLSSTVEQMAHDNRDDEMIVPETQSQQQSVPPPAYLHSMPTDRRRSV